MNFSLPSHFIAWCSTTVMESAPGRMAQQRVQLVNGQILGGIMHWMGWSMHPMSGVACWVSNGDNHGRGCGLVDACIYINVRQASICNLKMPHQ